jgi:phospholipid transport system transporter-binding protein
MNRLNIVKEAPGRFIVDGDLTFASLDKPTIQSFAFLTPGKDIIMDLGGVGNADSAGLALLIEWLKHARSKRVQLQLRNVPEAILNIAKLSDMDICHYFATGTPG